MFLNELRSPARAGAGEVVWCGGQHAAPWGLGRRRPYNIAMTWEMLIVAAFRVLGSLPVLRWAFIGALIAMLADLSDLFLIEAIHLGGVGDYQRFDKWLDQVYMATFLIVALRWAYVPRTIAVALYAYRMVGFVAFEIVGARDILLLFPNVFEFWFVFVSGL